MNGLSQIVDQTEAERLATGFVFTEGPLWHPDGFYYFVDVRASKFYRIRPGGAAELLRENTGEGNGTTSMTVPTSDGPQHITTPYTYTYGALQNGVFAVTFKGETWSGTAEVRPTRGDCVSAPITKVTAEGKGTLTS